METEHDNTTPASPSLVRPPWTYFLIPGAIVIAAFIFSSRIQIPGLTAQIGEDGPKVVKIEITGDDRVLGNPKAKVTIVEYSDFQCPFCRSFWNSSLQEMKRQYVDTGKAKLVYRHFPLAFHAMAQESAEAAECAGDQGKFWEAHDAIFGEQIKLNPEAVADPTKLRTIEFSSPDLERWMAAVPGLDVAQWRSCMQADIHVPKINDQRVSGTEAGVTGTPTTFINGRPVEGAQGFEAFQVIIEDELK